MLLRECEGGGGAVPTREGLVAISNMVLSTFFRIGRNNEVSFAAWI